MSPSDTDELPTKSPRMSTSAPKEQNGLFVLHDGETAVADIVAVHGLCGDPFGTWTEETSGKLWLRDFLPSQVPNTRIMSYGYESSVAFSKSELGLDNVAADLLDRLNSEQGTHEGKNRPVIFICHSLGGIVVKKALILAHDRSEAFGDLLKMVKALIFMGTPHRGTSVASWANFAALAFRTLQMNTATNPSLLSDLEGNSETLRQISQQFVERGSTIKMKTFYETRKLDYMNCLVVEKDSAILNLPTELPATPIFADHRSMCKFASRDEQKYRPVWRAVEHFVETLYTQKTGPITIQTALSIVGAVDSDCLLCHLPGVDQEFHKSRARPSGCDQAKFYWIFKNMDFDQWCHTKGMEVLWLSGPAECRISDASSHIVDLAKETYPGGQHSVLYFFCSTAPRKIPIAVTFVSTIVSQLIRCSPKLKDEITTTFLRTLLDTSFGEEPDSNPEVPRFSAVDSAEVVMKKILKASSDSYWSALRAVMEIECEERLSLIIDGLDKLENQKREFIQNLLVFIERLEERPSTTRVLLTSRPQAEIREMLGRLPSIEYDRERIECLNSLRFDNTRYGKIAGQHEGSLEWLWEHQSYLAWYSAESSDLLLIEGKPGSGKSTLMKYFHQSLLAQEPCKRQFVASFYYSYREGEKQTNHSNMLRSVLFDVLNQNEEFFSHFRYRQIGKGSGHPEWSYESLKGIIRSLIKRHPVIERLYLRERCGQVAGDSELISQLHTKLNDSSPAAYTFRDWIPGHEKQDEGKDFRGALLHAATRMKCPQVVEALLIAGAEVDADKDGKTPLIVTAKSGDLATARVLLNRGALIGAKDGNGQTALHLAAAIGHNPVARLLIDRGADKEAKDKEGQSPLHLAAANGHDLVVGLLIDRGAYKEAKDKENQTALHLAAANGHNPIIGLLVDRGANKEAKDKMGWGLLHKASWNDHEATIEMLVKTLNANKEERDRSGWTALHVAAMNGCDTASRYLIERLGADREAKDDVGWTALHFVAALGLGETAKLLIKTLGVDRGARNKKREKAEDLAKKYKNRRRYRPRFIRDLDRRVYYSTFRGTDSTDDTTEDVDGRVVTRRHDVTRIHYNDYDYDNRAHLILTDFFYREMKKNKIDYPMVISLLLE